MGGVEEGQGEEGKGKDNIGRRDETSGGEKERKQHLGKGGREGEGAGVKNGGE